MRPRLVVHFSLSVIPLLALQGFSFDEAFAQGQITTSRLLDAAIKAEQSALDRESDLEETRPREWQDAWVVETEHYIIRTNRSRIFARAVGRKLDESLVRFADMLGVIPDPDLRFRVEIYPDLPSYNKRGGEGGNNVNAVHSSVYGSFFYEEERGSPIVTYYSGNDELVYQWVAHSAWHQFLHTQEPRKHPVWIDEGLASYFGLFFNYPRELRILHSMSRGRLYLPLSQLLRLPLDQYDRRRFVQIGMFFYYLLDLREESMTRQATETEPEVAPFRDYLRRILRGQDVTGHPMHDMLQNRLSEVEQDFLKRFNLK